MPEILANVAVGVVVALAYLAAWIAWLTLGILPFILAGLGYLGVRYGIPAVIAVGLRWAAGIWDVMGHIARQVVPRHAWL